MVRGPQGHISDSAALWEAATLQRTCNHFYLLRMCKTVLCIGRGGSTSSISVQEREKKNFSGHAISG